MIASDLVIIGTTGMLGRELVEACKQRNVPAHPVAGRDALDITCQSAVRGVLGSLRPRVVINAAGYTDVDAAEREPDAAAEVNGGGVGILAGTCRELGAVLVHYSTDYVFDGRSRNPYRADDSPNPINAYGRSKLAGEQAIIAGGCQHLIVRTSWLFASHGRNFVRTIFGFAGQRPTLDVVDDQRGRPTFAGDLAVMTLDLLDQGARGILHAANAGHCTWYELAEATVKLAGLECAVRPCHTSAFPRPAQRPPFSVLDLGDTPALIGDPRPWKNALAECVQQLHAHRVSQAACSRGCRPTQ